MSKEIDERIVSMYFDNKQFEQGIETTMNSLDKFKKSLKFEDAVQGFDSIQKALDHLDFSEVIRNSTFAIEKFLQIHRHLDQLIQKIETTVKSLSIDQVSAGWGKYADKTSAVQTIMAATAKDFENTGEQMDYVNEQLEKLNWFTDETSYDFTAMTANIGKFTSNGVKLDDAVTAMEGISTWAALSGAKIEEANRAMYNLSQAMGVGAVKLIDWRSIQNANMGTREFKENVIEVALAMGKLKRAENGTIYADDNIEHIVSATNFEEYLKDGWFSADVLTTTLKKYGDFTDRLNKYINEISEAGTELTASDVLDYMKKFGTKDFDMQEAMDDTGLSAERLTAILTDLNSSEFELGRKAFMAAQEAKTFEEAINSVKDAVSTGWMNTFETIFGNYEEAKELWTDVANELYDVFAEGGNTRNKILKKWAKMTAVYGEEELTGRELFLKSFRNVWDSAKSVIETITDARNSVLFPGLKTDGEIIQYVADQLFAFSKSFYDATSKMKLSEDILAKVSNIFSNIFKTVKNIGSPIFNIVGKLVSGVWSIIQALAPYLLGALEKVSFAMSVLSGAFAKIANSAIGKVATWLGGVFLKIRDAVASMIEKIRSIELPDWMQSIVDWFKSVWDWLVAFGLAEDPVEEIAESAEQSEKRFAQSTKSMYDLVMEIIRGDYGNDPDRQAVLESLGLNYRDAQDLVNKIFTPYGEFIDGWEAIMEEYKNVPAELNLPEVEDVVPEEEVEKARTFSEILTDLKTKVMEGMPALFVKIGELAAKAFLKGQEIAATLNVKIGEIIEKGIALWERLKQIGGLKVADTGFFGVVKQIFSYLSGKTGLEGMFDIGNTPIESIKTMTDKFVEFKETIKSIIKSVGEFWKRLKNLGRIQFKDDGFFSVIKQIFGYLTGKDSLFSMQLENPLQAFGMNLGEGLTPAFKTLRTMFKEFRENIAETFSDVWKWLKQQWPKIKATGTDIWNWLKNFVESAKKLFKVLAPITKDSFTTFTESINNVFKNSPIESPKDFIMKIPEVFGAIKQMFVDIGAGILEKVDGAAEVFENVKTFIAGVVNSIKEFFIWLNEQLGIILGADSETESLLDKIPGMDVAKEFVDSLPTTQESFNAALQAVYDTFGINGDANQNPINQIFGALFGGVDSTVVTNAETAIESTGDVTKAVDSNIGAMLNTFISLSSESEEAQGALQNLGGMFNTISQIKSPQQAIATFYAMGGLEGIASTAQTDIETLVSATKESGVVLSEGLGDVSDLETLCTAFAGAWTQSSREVYANSDVTIENIEMFAENLENTTGTAEGSLSTTNQNAENIKKIFSSLLGIAKTVMGFIGVWRATGFVAGMGKFFKEGGKAIEAWRTDKYGSKPQKMVAGILKVVAAFTIVAGVVVALGYYDAEFQKGIANAAALALGIIAFYVIINLLEEKMPGADAGKSMLNFGLGILAITASIYILHGAIKKFNAMGWDEFANGFGKIIVMFFLIALASKAMGKNGTKGTAISILAVAVAVRILDNAVVKLGEMDLGDLVKGLVAVVIMLFAIGRITKTASGGLKGAGVILATAVAIIVLTAAVKILGDMDTGKLVKGVAAIGAMLFFLAQIMKKIGQITSFKGIVALVVMVIALVAIVAIFNYMEIPATSFLVIRAIATLFEGFGNMIKTLSSLPWNAGIKAAWNAASFIVVIVGIFAAIGEVLYLLEEKFGINASSGITAALSKLEPIFGEIGKILGAILVGIVEAFTEHGESIMGSVGRTINGFFSDLGSIDEANIEKSKSVITTLIDLLKIMPQDQTFSIDLLWGFFSIDVGSGRSWSSLSNGLPELAVALKSFANNMQGVDVEAIQNSFGTIEGLIGIEAKLPDTNRFEEWWGGVNSWDNLIGIVDTHTNWADSGFVHVGKALLEFSNAITEKDEDTGETISDGTIDTKAIKAALATIGEVAKIEAKLDNPSLFEEWWGGLSAWDNVIGVVDPNQNWSESGFVAVGKALRAFSNAVTYVDPETGVALSGDNYIDTAAILRSFDTIRSIRDFATELPNPSAAEELNAGMSAWDNVIGITSATDTETWTESGFVRVGKALRAFSNAVTYVDPETGVALSNNNYIDTGAILRSFDTIRKIRDFATELPDPSAAEELNAGMSAWDNVIGITAATDTKTWEESGFVRVGKALRAFSDAVTYKDPETGAALSDTKYIDTGAILRSFGIIKATSVFMNTFLPDPSATEEALSGLSAWDNVIGIVDVDQDWSESGFVKVGKSIAAFSSIIKGTDENGSPFGDGTGIDIEAMTSAFGLIDQVSALKSSLPDMNMYTEFESGLSAWDELIGTDPETKDWSESGIIHVARAMQAFSDIVTTKDPETGKSLGDGIDHTAILNAINTGKEINLFKGNLPDKDIFSEWVSGDDAFTELSTGLTGFGNALMAFGGAVADISSYKAGIDQAIELAGSLDTLLDAYAKYYSTTIGGNLSSDISNLASSFKDFKGLDEDLDTENISTFIGSVTTLIDNLIKPILTSGTTYISFTEAMKTLATDGVGSFTAGIAGSYSTIYGALFTDDSSFKQYVVNSVIGADGNGHDEILKGFATLAGHCITKFANTFISQDQSATYDLAATNFKTEVVGRMFEAGAAAVQGIINGMNSKVAELHAASRALGIGTAMALRASLQVNSPSKVTFGIGMHVGEGLVNALVASITPVQNASSDLAVSMIDILDEASQFAADAISEDVSPVITPVVDMSNVSQSAGYINSMFGGGTWRMDTSINAAKATRTSATPSAAQQNAIIDYQQSLAGIREDINTLSQSINNMQIVMDSGVLVGQIAAPMDRALGRRTVHAARRN